MKRFRRCHRCGALAVRCYRIRATHICLMCHRAGRVPWVPERQMELFPPAASPPWDDVHGLT